MTSSIAKNRRQGQHGEQTRSTVSIPLVDLLHDAEAGVLGLSVQVGRRVLQELMDQEVTDIAGPIGRHNPQHTAVRHGPRLTPMSARGTGVLTRRASDSDCYPSMRDPKNGRH